MATPGPYSWTTDSGGDMSYHADFDLLVGSSSKTGAVITVHGSSRTGSTYFSTGKSARDYHGKTANYEFFAPQYLHTDDDAPAANYLSWDNGWRSGITADNFGSTVQTSSYYVMEEMINMIIAAMPNLTHINMIGNSAGGGFTCRMAMGITIRNIPMKFIPYNFAGMWWDEERPTRCDRFSYALPPDNNKGRSWNSYPYGTDGLYIYFSSHIGGLAQMRTNYANSEIVFTTGADDDDLQDSDLGKAPSEMWGGRTRAERGDSYWYRVKNIEFPGGGPYYRSRPVACEHSMADGLYTDEGGHYAFTPPGSGPYTP